MTASTELRSVLTARRERSIASALVLTIAGNMLVAVVLGVAVAAVAVAAVAVFGAGVLDLV